MDLRSARSSPCDGETLVELLMTIAILGIAVVTIMLGLATSASTGSLNKEQGKVNAALSSASEYVRSLPFQACGSTPTITPGVPADSNITVSVVGPLDPSAGNPFQSGLERFTIKVSASGKYGIVDQEQDVLLVCDGSMTGGVCS